MANGGSERARLPPRWFVRLGWLTHRGLYRATGGRIGLRRLRANQWGVMRLTTTGRRSGQERSVLLGYFGDDPTLVTMAMDGWADPEAPGGSTSKLIRMGSSISNMADARSRGGPPRERNGRVSGPGGAR